MNPEQMFNRAHKVAKIMNEINQKLKELDMPEIPFDDFMNLSYNKMRILSEMLDNIKEG